MDTDPPMDTEAAFVPSSSDGGSQDLELVLREERERHVELGKNTNMHFKVLYELTY